MNIFVFWVLYLFFMIPTYVIRFALFGSIFEENGAEQVAEMATGANIFLAICLFLLILIGLFRGLSIGKPWLVVFPIIAFVFDMVLVFIPLVPTVMHILALILGSIEEKKA